MESKFHISVVSGVANVYPDGMKGAGVLMRAGDNPMLFSTKSGLHIGLPLPDQANDDFVAPAAGVATNEPFGKREGVIKVHAEVGPVCVRTYEGSDFTEKLLSEGEMIEVPVTETNRETLAVYEVEGKPK